MEPGRIRKPVSNFGYPTYKISKHSALSTQYSAPSPLQASTAIMPMVSPEEIFASFGFSQSRVAQMAAEHRKANGGLQFFGYIPDTASHDEDDDDGALISSKRLNWNDKGGI
jgi:hypothetical protein